MAVLLRIDDLWVKALSDTGSEQPIVKGVSLSVSRGEVVALVGESGSGKTTVSLAALGYAKPGCRIAGGRVLLDGVDVLGLSGEPLRRIRGNRVSYLAQSAAATFNPALTIGEQVTEAAVLHGRLSRAEAAARAVDLYRRLDLPDPGRIGTRYPHQVSGGQLQRLMAAMALCSGPELLVLDEPTTALDVTTQIEVLGAFKEVISDRGTAAIYVSHDIAVVAQFADRIIVLNQGEIVEAAETGEIIDRPRHQYTRRLIAAVKPAPDSAETRSPETTGAQVHGIPVVAVESVSASYGTRDSLGARVRVLDNVDIAIPAGVVVGVVGESGCGKSTLARVISGLLPAESGTVTLRGKPLAPQVRARSLEDLNSIQIVFQMADVALNPRQRVSEIVGRPLAFYRKTPASGRRERIALLLAMVGLPAEFADRYPESLSGGQKQRVNLARALAAEPELILCDEVTSSLDAIVGASIVELLKGLRETTGVSYLFISHDLPTVASFASRIVVLYAGRMVESGTVAEVLRPPFHPYTRLLLSSVPQLRRGWLEEVMSTTEARSSLGRPVAIAAPGCPFYDRCPLAIDGTCNVTFPEYHRVGQVHRVACHRSIDELNIAMSCREARH